MHNAYFTMGVFPTTADARMTINSKWAVPAHLGGEYKSKTVMLKTFEGELAPGAKPSLTYLVLRAWMVWRANKPAFLAACSARQRWHEEEKKALKDDIVAHGGLAAHRLAEGVIRQVCLDLL